MSHHIIILKVNRSKIFGVLDALTDSFISLLRESSPSISHRASMRLRGPITLLSFTNLFLNLALLASWSYQDLYITGGRTSLPQVPIFLWVYGQRIGCHDRRRFLSASWVPGIGKVARLAAVVFYRIDAKWGELARFGDSWRVGGIGCARRFMFFSIALGKGTCNFFDFLGVVGEAALISFSWGMRALRMFGTGNIICCC